MFITALFVAIILLADSYFRIVVDGINIKVRTKTGKKYEFDAAKIKKVKARWIRRGINKEDGLFLEIDTEDNHFVINMEKNGAEKMLLYLIKLYKSGFLDSQVIDDDCKKILFIWKGKFKQRGKYKEEGDIGGVSNSMHD